MDQNRIIVGFNLGSRFSELCWKKQDDAEPQLYRDAESSIEIATALYKSGDHWICGQEAFDQSMEGAGQLVTDFLDNYEEIPEIDTIEGVYRKKDLVSIYVKEMLECLRAVAGDFEIGNITFTMKSVNKLLAADLVAAAVACGVSKSAVRVQSHIASFEYYALTKDKELWFHDVGMFSYDEEGLNYYHISVNNKKTPAIATARKIPLNMYMPYQMVKNQTKELLDQTFVQVLNEVLAHRLITTIYLSGKGFEDGAWLGDAKRRLCSGRKVFLEEGIFALGACCCGVQEDEGLQYSQFVALNDDMLPYSIYLKGYGHREILRQELTSISSSWYSVHTEAQFILDQTDTVTLRVRDYTAGKEKLIPLKLDNLEDRPEKTLRLKLEVSYEDDTICRFTLTDLGFGEQYPSTEMVWSKRINVAEYEEDKDYREQGRLLFTKPTDKVKPYIMPISETGIYSVEELCYYLCNNVYILNKETFSPALLTWLKEELGEVYLAEKIEKQLTDETDLLSLIMTVISAYDYYSREECTKIGYMLEEIDSLHPLEYKKLQADYLVHYGRIMEAVPIYIAIAGQMESLREKEINMAFRGSVYHNLGVAYVHIMNYSSAAASFYHAYEMNQDDESLKSCLLAHKLADNETGFFDVMEDARLPEEYVEALMETYEQTVAGMPKTRAIETEEIPARIRALKKLYRD